MRFNKLFVQKLQDLQKGSTGSFLAEPIKQPQLSSVTGGIEGRLKSSSEAPIARLESLEEAGADGSTQETKTPSIYKQRSSDV